MTSPVHIAPANSPTLCGLDPSPDLNAYDFCSIDVSPGWCPTCVRLLEQDHPLTDERREALAGLGIFAIAQALWMHKTGAAEGMPDAEWYEARAYLTERVMTWSVPPDGAEWPAKDAIDHAALVWMQAVLIACQGRR